MKRNKNPVIPTDLSEFRDQSWEAMGYEFDDAALDEADRLDKERLLREFQEEEEEEIRRLSRRRRALKNRKKEIDAHENGDIE